MKKALTSIVVFGVAMLITLNDAEARGGFRPDAVHGAGGIGGGGGGISGVRSSASGARENAGTTASSRRESAQIQRQRDINAQRRQGTRREQEAVDRRQAREAAHRERTDNNDQSSGTWVGAAPVGLVGAAPVVSYTLGGEGDPEDPLNPARYGNGYHSHRGYYAGGYRGAHVGGDRNHLGTFPD